jgi:hypothetical protein
MRHALLIAAYWIALCGLTQQRAPGSCDVADQELRSAAACSVLRSVS